ncbi:MAG: hypothetical protein Q8O22_01135 [Candidatus Omnitrophota bacterium]|nr:hypothetical protein [Candidatus Omnitrophota bacterium]
MGKKRTIFLILLGVGMIFFSLVYFMANHLNASDGFVDIMCLLWIIFGAGIILLQNWSRIMTMVISIVTALLTLWNSRDCFLCDGGLMLLMAALLLIPFFYLRRPKVKLMFNQPIK